MATVLACLPRWLTLVRLPAKRLEVDGGVNWDVGHYRNDVLRLSKHTCSKGSRKPGLGCRGY
jgi:hypothetical protein